MKNIVAFASIGGAKDWFYDNVDGHSYHCTNPYSLKFYGERFDEYIEGYTQIMVPGLKRFFEINGWEFDQDSMYSKSPDKMLYALYVYVDRTGSAGQASAFESFDKVFGKHYVCPNKLFIPYDVAKAALETDDKALNIKLEFRSEGNECETFQCCLHIVGDSKELPEKL